MKVVVTGGGGFLGRRILERCLERGDEVTSVSRGAYPELEALGAQCVRGDLGEKETASRAIAGADLVFHVAAKAGVWGSAASYERANVLATRHVIAACREHQVPKLVFTSSPSVCFDGEDHVNAGKDLPYPERYLAHYPRTKALAEQEVLGAHSESLATVALRPHLIVGPRDPHLVPRLLDRGRAGKLRIVGRGDNEVSLTHVDNAAEAHLCAASALSFDAACGGQAYFVANDEPVKLWDWVNALFAAHGIPPVTRRISAGAAYKIGAVCEGLWAALRLKGEPPMTRFVAKQLATSHSYDLSALKAETGYAQVTADNGIA